MVSSWSITRPIDVLCGRVLNVLDNQSQTRIRKVLTRPFMANFGEKSVFAPFGSLSSSFNAWCLTVRQLPFSFELCPCLSRARCQVARNSVRLNLDKPTTLWLPLLLFMIFFLFLKIPAVCHNSGIRSGTAAHFHINPSALMNYSSAHKPGLNLSL